MGGLSKSVLLCSLVKIIKKEPPFMCLATMAYVYAACTVHVTIFSTGGKF